MMTMLRRRRKSDASLYASYRFLLGEDDLADVGVVLQNPLGFGQKQYERGYFGEKERLQEAFSLWLRHRISEYPFDERCAKRFL